MLAGENFNEVAIWVAKVDRCYRTKRACSWNRTILNGYVALAQMVYDGDD